MVCGGVQLSWAFTACGDSGSFVFVKQMKVLTLTSVSHVGRCYPNNVCSALNVLAAPPLPAELNHPHSVSPSETAPKVNPAAKVCPS